MTGARAFRELGGGVRLCRHDGDDKLQRAPGSAAHHLARVPDRPENGQERARARHGRAPVARSAYISFCRSDMEGEEGRIPMSREANQEKLVLPEANYRPRRAHKARLYPWITAQLCSHGPVAHAGATSASGRIHKNFDRPDQPSNAASKSGATSHAPACNPAMRPDGKTTGCSIWAVRISMSFDFSPSESVSTAASISARLITMSANYIVLRINSECLCAQRPTTPVASSRSREVTAVV